MLVHPMSQSATLLNCSVLIADGSTTMTIKNSSGNSTFSPDVSIVSYAPQKVQYSTVTVGIVFRILFALAVWLVRSGRQPLISCGKEVVDDHAYVILQILHINRDMASALIAWMSCAIALLLHCVLEISSIHRRETGCLLSLREVWYSLPGPGRSQPVTSITRARKVHTSDVYSAVLRWRTRFMARSNVQLPPLSLLSPLLNGMLIWIEFTSRPALRAFARCRAKPQRASASLLAAELHTANISSSSSSSRLRPRPAVCRSMLILPVTIHSVLQYSASTHCITVIRW